MQDIFMAGVIILGSALVINGISMVISNLKGKTDVERATLAIIITAGIGFVVYGLAMPYLYPKNDTQPPSASPLSGQTIKTQDLETPQEVVGVSREVFERAAKEGKLIPVKIPAKESEKTIYLKIEP